MNFKKISEPNQGKKGKSGNPSKSGTKVQVDLLLHVIANESGDKDAIPLPGNDDEVSFIFNFFYNFTNVQFRRKGKLKLCQFPQP